jgi:putative addiction module killer protein
MIEVREYLNAGGRSPYAAWFERPNREAAVKVAAAPARVQQGNLSNAKGVGAGVYEYRIDFGPGYRIYFGKDGDRMVILVGGGTKKRQQQDLQTALGRWQEYNSEKAQQGEWYGLDTKFQTDNPGARKARSRFPQSIAAGRHRELSLR